MPIGIDACVAHHIGDRKEQQDRVGLFPHPRKSGVALAVVADGMGGHTGGSLAAEQVLYTARSNLERFSISEDSPRSLLETSIEEAHTLIKTMRMVNEKDPHSTAVMLLLTPGKIAWAHCGDSRYYHFRGDKPFFRTTDHSYVEHLVSEKKITLAQALNHPNRNVLMTSLGGGESPRINYSETSDMKVGDSFLLCSDGLWGYFSDDELAELIAASPAKEAARVLVEKARSRAQGDGDNLSVIILKLIEAPTTKPGQAYNRRV